MKTTARQMQTDRLHPHPCNTRIYGNGQPSPDFVDNIKQHGILVPLAITKKGTIISGMRRWQAAKICGVETVPVEVVSYKSELEEREAIINYNKQRDKTFSQRMAEAAELEAIEAAAAKQAQVEAGKKYGRGQPKKVKQIFAEPIGQTRDAVAAAVGLGSGETYRQAKKVCEAATMKADPAVQAVAKKEIQKLDRRETTVHAAYREVREAERRQQRINRQQEALRTLLPLSNRYRVIHGDIAEVYEDIEEPVDVIITDAPYAGEYVKVYGTLARVAVEVLKPGGSLLVMTGQSHLPDIFSEMKVTGLTYNWTVAYLTSGNQAPQVVDRRVAARWKPVLWFVKGGSYGSYNGYFVGDVVRAEPIDNERQYHPHGQSEAGIAELVRRFSEPGDTVLDPFCGGGTTAVAALSLDRKFIGVDIDEAAVDTTLGRIAELLK